jgi:squalene synthase HpnC
MSVDHYENFPVASWLMPARLRPAVGAIYDFARTADDLADEGDRSNEQRLAALRDLAQQLDAIEAGAPHQWPQLAEAISAHKLPVQPLRDLLSAFSQDVSVHSYASYADLLDYCRRSANPIGRLLLALYQCDDEASLAQSDAICSALQLINFWQDVAIDLRKGRAYIPRSELDRMGLLPEEVGVNPSDTRWIALMRSLTGHARTMLLSGAPLPPRLGGRVGLELRMVLQGGLRILERIDAVHGDVFAHRPVLRAFDWALMAIRALRM